MTNHLIDLYICVYDVFVLASLGLAQTVESQNEEDSWCLVSVKSGLLPAQVTDNKVENGLFFLCGEIPVLFICAFFFFLTQQDTVKAFKCCDCSGLSFLGFIQVLECLSGVLSIRRVVWLECLENCKETKPGSKPKLK